MTDKIKVEMEVEEGTAISSLLEVIEFNRPEIKDIKEV